VQTRAHCIDEYNLKGSTLSRGTLAGLLQSAGSEVASRAAIPVRCRGESAGGISLSWSATSAFAVAGATGAIAVAICGAV
jgi:hypothetical protein